MIWAQAIGCFVIWLGYGWFLRGRSRTIRRQVESWSRLSRVLLGSAGILASAAILLVGLWLVTAAGWVGPNGLSPLGLVAVSVLGLIFVHAQVLSSAALVTLMLERETAGPLSASQSKNGHEA